MNNLEKDIIRQFSNGIAHSFNNILTTIVGCGEILKHKIEKTDYSSLIYIHQILEASQRASKQIRALKSFSNDIGIRPSQLNINSIVKNFGILASEILGQKINVVLDLCNYELIASVDRFQIERVLTILAFNSKAAMPDGGIFTIKTGRIDNIATKDKNNFVSITVKDTGCGIDDKIKERIFEPFFTTGNGMGLGLSVAYWIIKKHNGYINCLSGDDRGATFQILLPEVKI